jgi:ribokinase
VIAVPPDGKKAILLAANANDEWDEQAVRDMAERVAASPPGSILTVDFEVPAPVVRRAAEAAGALGLRVVVDPSWPDRVERELLADVFAIAPNAAEAEALVGVKVTDPESGMEAARRIAALGPVLALVKLEDGGCVLAGRGGTGLHIPAQPVSVVDTTGAGDAFTGALAVALLEGKSPRDAALFAVAASHAAVTGWGSQPAYPDRDAIEARIPDLARSLRDWST